MSTTNARDYTHIIGLVEIRSHAKLLSIDPMYARLDVLRREVRVSAKDGSMKFAIFLKSSYNHGTEVEISKVVGIDKQIKMQFCTFRDREYVVFHGEHRTKSNERRIEGWFLGLVTFGFETAADRSRFIRAMWKDISEVDVMIIKRASLRNKFDLSEVWFLNPNGPNPCRARIGVNDWATSSVQNSGTQQNKAPLQLNPHGTIPTTLQQSRPHKPITIYIGAEKRPTYLFSGQFDRLCNLLSREESSTTNESGDRQISLPEEDPADFDVFTRWLLFRKIPSNLFSITPSEGTQSKNGVNVFMRMNQLYSMAIRFEAVEFKNLLMDSFVLATAEADMKDFSISYLQPAIRNSMLHKLYIRLLVAGMKAQKQQPTQEGISDLMSDKFDPNLAEVYYEILQAQIKSAEYRESGPKIEAHLFHEHTGVYMDCYSEECNRYRKERSSDENA